jgi:hypothetical protein
MNKFDNVPQYKFIYEDKSIYKSEDGSNEESKVLKDTFESAIKSTIQSKIHLNLNKDHKIIVTVLKGDNFSIVIDGKTKFFLSKKKTAAPQQEDYVIIQEKIKNKTLFQSFKDFWKGVFNLCYTPAFPNPALKARNPREAVQQDFRSLRKSLESGYVWLTSPVQVKHGKNNVSNENAEDLKTIVKSTVSNAKKIEEALKDKDQAAALEKVASEFAETVCKQDRLWKGFVIPTGYLNHEGILQPVMLRFHSTKERSFNLEIYSDTTKEASKISSTIVMSKENVPGKDEIKKIILSALLPLTEKKIDKEKLIEATKPNQTFKILFDKKTAIPPEETKKTKEAAKSEAHEFSYETFLRSLERTMGKEWKDVTDKEQKLIQQPGTPAARVEKWFSHLCGDNLNRHDKLSLLFVLTNEWIDDQLKQLSDDLPLHKKLAVYEQCLGQIQHIKEKIALAINEGHPLDPEYGIPETLKKQEEHCTKEIASIKKVFNQEAIELQGKFSQKPQSEKLNVPISKPPSPLVEAAALEVKGTPIEKADWTNEWNKSIGEFSQVLSEENLQKQRAQQVVIQLEKTIKSKSLDIKLEAVINELCSTDPTKMPEVDKLIDALLLNEYKDNSAENLEKIGKEDFSIIVKEWILCPHLFPDSSTRFTPAMKAIIKFFRKVQDPNSSFPSEKKQASQDLRTLLNLRHIIPKESKEAFLKHLIDKQADSYKTHHKGAANSNEYLNFIEEANQENSFDPIVKMMDDMPSVVKENLQLEEASEDTKKFREEVKNCLGNLTAQVLELKESALAENTCEKRRALLEEAKQHSLQILKMLPPPGTEGSAGEPSIWYDFSHDERQDLLKNIHSLEHLIWECQMKLAKPEMDGKERFLLIKAQAIRQAMVRAEISETQAAFEEFANKKFTDKPAEIQAALGKIVIIDPKTPHILKIDWRKSEGELTVRKLIEFIKENDKDNEFTFNVGYLALDCYTMDTLLCNQLIAQDLTACLGENAELEKDVLAIYHFILRDNNRGTRDNILLVETLAFRKALGQNYGEEIVRDLNLKDTEKGEIIELVNQMKKGDLYYCTASDPDFTLSGENPTPGVTYFQSKPNELLSHNHVDLEIRENESTIVGDGKKSLANVQPSGDAKLEIKARKPFLPIIDNSIEWVNRMTAYESRISDIRTVGYDLDTWSEYTDKLSQAEKISIPPQVLKQLFQIRQTSGGSKERGVASFYSSDTALNALSFLTNPLNQSYLEHDFVQQFLEESLLGSFVMQQTLIEYPEKVLKLLELLFNRLGEAQKTENLRVYGFLSNVLSQLELHVKFTQGHLKASGWFSGLINGSLPSHIGRAGGLFETYFHGEADSQKDPENISVMDFTQTHQPLIYRIKKIGECHEFLKGAIDVVNENSFRTMCFTSNFGNNRPIDKIKEQSIQKQVYIYALQSFRLDFSGQKIEELSPEDLGNILYGYNLLQDTSIEVGLNSLQHDLMKWVQMDILPHFEKQKEEEKNQILTTLLHQDLKRNNPKFDSSYKGKWTCVSPNTYSLPLPGKAITIDLYHMEIPNMELESKKEIPAYLPDEILKRTDVQQALSKEKILAKKSAAAGINTYTWEGEGSEKEIKFSLKESNGRIIITKTINKENYTFTPVSLEKPKNQAEALLAKHGIWTADGEQERGYIFAEEGQYLATLKNGAVVKIEESSPKKLLVSSSTALEQVRFSNSKNIVTLLDPASKLPVEMRLKGTNLSLKKEGTSWVLYQGEVKKGPISYSSEHEKPLVEAFGKNWDQYVIPFEVEKDNKKVIEYMMFPYVQQMDSRGNLAADHDSLQGIRPEILTVQKNGSIQGSISAELYLIHRFLIQASHTKNTTAARQLYMEAEKRLYRLQKERPPSGSSLENLNAIMHLIESHPPVSLDKNPSPISLTLSLRLYLTMRKMRTMSQNLGVSALANSHKKNFEELEKVVKCYAAYCVMKKSTDYNMFKAGDQAKIHKTFFNLTEDEEAELLGMSRQILQEISTNIENESIASYFETGGRLAASLQMDCPKTLDPQFILSLLRIAKPADPTIDLQKEDSPMPLDKLLENFWSYFASIHRGSITPDKLVFLYQPSLLPSNISLEEHAQLKAIDQQARQFLLAIAEAHRKKNEGFKQAIKMVEDGKKAFLEWQEKSHVADFCSGLDKTTLQTSFGNLKRAIDEINLEGIEDDSNETKMNALKKAITEVDTHLWAFKNEVSEVIAKGKKYQAEQKDKVENFKSEIARLEGERENCSDEELKKVDIELEELQRQLNDFLASKIDDGITDSEGCIADIMSGTYEVALGFNQLTEIAREVGEASTALQASMKNIKDVEKVLEFSKGIGEFCGDLESPFTPSPWLELPKNKETGEKIEKIMENQNLPLIEKLGVFISTSKEIGVSKTAKLAFALGDKSLESKLGLFAKPLGGIVSIAENLKTITVKGKTPKAMNPLQIEQIQNHPAAKQCFTPDQLDKLQDNIAKVDPSKQQSLIEQLSEALKENETILAAQTGLQANMDAIEKSYKRQFPKEPPQQEQGIKPQFTHKASHFKDQYADYYKVPLAWPKEHEHEQKHQILVNELIAKTLPDDQESLYAKDLKQGLENLRQNNPLPYSLVVRTEQIEGLKAKVLEDSTELEKSQQKLKLEILNKIKTIPISELPKEAQRLRLKKGSEEELLEEVCKAYRKGLIKDPLLDQDISDFLVDDTRLKMQVKAQESVQELSRLKSQKEGLQSKITASRNLLNSAHKNTSNEGVIYYAYRPIIGKDEKGYNILATVAVRYTEEEYLNFKNELTSLENQLESIDLKWMKESAKIKDCLDRCQSTKHLEDLPDTLKPHARKIIYLQNRLGMTLRKNQIDTLQEIVDNPALLKQLRMGLGKTSVILPFALELLASLGYNAIGMVPKALFDTNFQEMDDTTRLIFELAGNQFLFNRQDAPQPFSIQTLCQITQKCSNFLQAFDRREFLLTTIESKASLDNKLIEIERSLSRVQAEIDEIKKEKRANKTIDTEESIKQMESLYTILGEHQTALNALYSVKKIFEHEKTRIIIDEVDQVARANYTVNAEMGIKEAPDPILTNAVASIFDIIRDASELKELREPLYANNQFTLTKEMVDEQLEMIGGLWLERNKDRLPEHLRDPKDLNLIVEWFAGKGSPFKPPNEDFKEISDADPGLGAQLKVMKRALNSSLRSSLSHKISLNGEFDSLHSAIGVPASQGITSETTKYSDPLMQLCLTTMIATYKPQGEPFLKSSVADVFIELQLYEKELKDNLEKNVSDKRLAEELDLVTRSITKLSGLLEKQKDGTPISYSTELQGIDSVDVLLRQKFAQQVAKRKLIYMSAYQISRPVQHALRGCHIIGLTGTATRNVEHVINSTGTNGVTSTGRESTAEVLYRLAKALPQGLETPVKTYSPNSDDAVEEIQSFAKKGSGYNFLINQAGACDKLMLHEIIDKLHEVGKRPIIFMNISKQGNFKCVKIDGKIKPLDSLSPTEMAQVKKNGFYYYHTPHARGVHFDIPIGSKGAIYLSPTVNANDRDQGIYRARELGEGHIVEPFISESQHDKLCEQYKDEMKKKGIEKLPLSYVLKANHNKTQKDESNEDLPSYHLHLQGYLLRAIETAKNDGQPVFGSVNEDEAIAKISANAKVSDMFKNFFISDSGKKAYQRQLDGEVDQGAESYTKENLEQLIAAQIEKTKSLLAKIDNQIRKNFADPDFQDTAFHVALTKARDTIANAEKGLIFEQNNFEAKWDAVFQKQFSETSPAAPAIDQISETEAEGMAQQEAAAETAGETEKTQRVQATKSIFMEVDEELLKSSHAEKTHIKYLTPGFYNKIAGTDREKTDAPIGKPLLDITSLGVYVSDRLAGKIESSMPEVKLIVLKEGEKDIIIAVDNWEGNQAAGSNSCFRVGNKLINAYTVQVGHPTLLYDGGAMGMKGNEAAFNEDKGHRAHLLLALMALGCTQFSQDDLDDLKLYWPNCNDEEKTGIQKALTARLEGKNPDFLNKIGELLWKRNVKPVDMLGGTKKEQFTDFDEAANALQTHLNPLATIKIDIEREVNKWIGKNIEDTKLKEDLRDKFLSPKV